MAAAQRAFDYLESLPTLTLRKLYTSPSTTLVIYRYLLPHLAKTLIMSLLFLPGPMPVSQLDLLVPASSKAAREDALARMDQLKMRDPTPPGEKAAFVMNEVVKRSLRAALTGMNTGGKNAGGRNFGTVYIGTVSSRPGSRKPVDSTFLDHHARNQWDRILHYMVGSVAASLMGDSGRELTASVQSLLVWGNLVEMRNNRPQITKLGFEFLLQEVNAQVWTLLIQYFENAHEKLDLVIEEVLVFIFMLSGLQLGVCYEAGGLTEGQRRMLPDLQDLGLILLSDDSGEKASSASYYYPTRLATTLTSSPSLSTSLKSSITTSPSAGFIIIETNYRLYAYTSSPLQIAILALFSDLTARYPNMISAKIRRSTVRKAVEYGITADQIISFLATHAHPQMLRRHGVQSVSNPQEQQSTAVSKSGDARSSGVGILPPTVVDQIRLWQMEYERVKATSGYLIRGFDAQGGEGRREYERSVTYADDIGVLAWRDDRGRRFFVTRVEQLAAFMKERGGGGSTG